MHVHLFGMSPFVTGIRTTRVCASKIFTSHEALITEEKAFATDTVNKNQDRMTSLILNKVSITMDDTESNTFVRLHTRNSRAHTCKVLQSN